MNLDEPFREPAICTPLVEEIHRSVRNVSASLRIMEVCGTHTVSVFRHGIRTLLPSQITLLSGPGCPVCVTPAGHIDLCLQAAQQQDVVLATFGDLLRVPGSSGSLADARARGLARVQVVYSSMDALELARQDAAIQVVFPAIGFETTAPTIAATVLAAEQLGVENFFVIPLAKTMPEALMLLLGDAQLKLSGLLCPGHVSAIIGAAAYQPLVERFGLGCAVAGFEPADILAGLLALVQQQSRGKAQVDNCYPRAVSQAGNERAQALLAKVFMPVASEWRGLGSIPASGLALRDPYQRFDAVQRLQLTAHSVPDPPGCRCGSVLKGMIQPPQCPLYGSRCTPLSPIGPCMVSAEGSCAAYYTYSGSRYSETGSKNSGDNGTC